MKSFKNRGSKCTGPISTVGLIMPNDFPVVYYEAVSKALIPHKEVEAHKETWAQFAAAWNGLAYRYLSCWEHNSGFTKAIRKSGKSPLPPQRYIQERELFNFFTSGLAALECFSFGVYAIGAILKPEFFPMKSEDDMRKIKLKLTANMYEKSFPQQGITSALKNTAKSSQLGEWRDIRNILIHRSAPGRKFHIGGESHGLAIWNAKIEINEKTTSVKYEWLTSTLVKLVSAADEFTSKHFN
jgi:hypothetical protein